MSLIGRNIKPENILLDKDGHCKLGDFGISKLGMWMGSSSGTLPFMAPEVIITVYFTCDACVFVE